MRFRHIVALLCLTLAAPATAQEAAPTGAEGSYRQALREALAVWPPDMVALRRVYAADPAYDGTAELKELRTAQMLGEPAPDDAAVIDAIAEDFPLADTHFEAFLHYKALNDTDQMAIHAKLFQLAIDAILATRHQVDGLPAYTVLSVGEEYALLSMIDHRVSGQALIMVEGRRYDRLETDKGPVLFDISAFFGR